MRRKTALVTPLPMAITTGAQGQKFSEQYFEFAAGSGHVHIEGDVPEDFLDVHRVRRVRS